MQLLKLAFIGTAAGIINGLFGTGGGMILIPLLMAANFSADAALFSTSVCIMLPISVVSLMFSDPGSIPLNQALPYLIGGAGGGILAGFLGKYVPARWLHRLFGILILWGGLRYLC